MTEQEIKDLRNSIADRLSDYAGCSTESALKFIKVMRSSFSCEGALLYHISDNLYTKGY